MQEAARWSCCVCGRGVGSNSIQCTSCQMWVHKKCCGISSSSSSSTRFSVHLQQKNSRHNI